jgi:SAM-dependent methyltransferase
VLDLGCGKGAFLRFLKNRNEKWALTGIDLSENDSCEGITFIRGDILRKSLEQKFDVIVSLAVIEHVVDVDQFMKRIADHLSKDGMAIVMTVNDQSVTYKSARVFNALGIRSAFERLYSRHHLNHFSQRSLEELVRKHGFKVEERFTFHNSLKSIDVPPASFIIRATQLLGLGMIFLLEDLFSRACLQTIICRSKTVDKNRPWGDLRSAVSDHRSVHGLERDSGN